MRLLAAGGSVDGRMLVPESVLTAVWEPQVPLDPADGFVNHPTAPVSYGLGWASFDHAGQRVYEHTGGGMSSVIAVIPSAKLSVGIFTNARFGDRHVYEGILFASALKLRVLDHHLGLTPHDWLGEFDSALGG